MHKFLIYAITVTCAQTPSRQRAASEWESGAVKRAAAVCAVGSESGVWRLKGLRGEMGSGSL